MALGNPLVSITVPFYNPCSGGREEKWFRECIESILGQSYRNIEAVLISDGSTDQSVAVAEEYQKKDPRVAIVKSTPNLGVVHALNLGLRHSKGEFIGVLGSDDMLMPQYAELVLQGFGGNPDAMLVGGQRVFVDFRDRKSVPPSLPLDYSSLKEFAKKSCPFVHPVIRRELIELIGVYPSDYPAAEDYAYWVRALAAAKCINIPHVILCIRKHGNRISVQLRDNQLSSSRRIQEEARATL